MQRSLMKSLIEWKNRPNRKPLLLRGARQTGKTWLMEEFARAQFKDYVKIDFLLDESARALFANDLDPARIIAQIELRTGRRIDSQNTLIIFDEMQEAPRGLTSLKYFCEQAREYYVMAAGSYMGIAMRQNDSFPVGKVDQLVLRPMDFTEFLAAVAGDPLAEAVRRADFDLLSLSKDMLDQRLKEYLVVGGMPEVVDTFAKTNDLAETRRLQLQILSDYDNDFGKHAPARILERMRLVWRSLPGQLARENKKFIYGAVRPGARARDFEESLQWLSDYGVVHKVPRSSALRVPLAGHEDESAFKLFCLDVGLLGALADLNPTIVLEGSRLFSEFKGEITEQYVAQQLINAGHNLAYWSSSTGTAETDFAFEANGAVVPIEVKAGENLRSKSLRVACDKFGLSRAVRTSLSNYRDEGWLVNIPLWAIGSIDQFV